MKPKIKLKTSTGQKHPLGATVTDRGVNFAIRSKSAQKIDLHLYANDQSPSSDMITLNKSTDDFWHIFVEGLQAGQYYGYKIHGPYEPKDGLRINENKLLIDPYAKAVNAKAINFNGLLLGYQPNDPLKDLGFDQRSNEHVAVKSVIIDDEFEWHNDQKPNIPSAELIIYETHLKAVTAHPSAKVKNPGTYLGLIEKIPYFKELGINCIELLPIQEFFIRDYLAQNKLTEFWGYNTIAFFAPEISYSSRRYPGCQVEEFKTMVREFHKAGIEIILDVVYNHTGEEGELGPTLSFRGIDNGEYYALKGDEQNSYRYYDDRFTGCGNMFNVNSPMTMDLIFDSLHYWVKHMHVDGFRFDLTSVLAHEHNVFKADGQFLTRIQNDPILKDIKIIAEPWDLKGHYYHRFKSPWLKWNDHFRNVARKSLRGDVSDDLNHLSVFFTGKGATTEDQPLNESINFITCHDGFTLNDLFSYKHKHNHLNYEHNIDGSDVNFSTNCSIEGPTNDPDVLMLRKKMAKNALCCLFLSKGIPMMLGGDEFLRTQKGNNNAYCQDNELTWFNWKFLDENHDIFDFCKKMILFRSKYNLLIHPYESVVLHQEQNYLQYKLSFTEMTEDYNEFLVTMNFSNEEKTFKTESSNSNPWKLLINTDLLSPNDFNLIPQKNTNFVDTVVINPKSIFVVARKSLSVKVT